MAVHIPESYLTIIEKGDYLYLSNDQIWDLLRYYKAGALTTQVITNQLPEARKEALQDKSRLPLISTSAAPSSIEEKRALASLAQPELPAGTGVFISYRRSDEPSFAGRLYDRLIDKFDERHIFMDVDSIELGTDFVEVLNAALGACKVVIVVIGPEWLTASDAQGRRRLDNPNDFVRLEVQTALKRNIRVIPILVGGAQMPRSADLPPSLSALSRRNGREISHARFSSDIHQLISTLERVLADS
jgi:hypothetical protein